MEHGSKRKLSTKEIIQIFSEKDIKFRLDKKTKLMILKYELISFVIEMIYKIKSLFVAKATNIMNNNIYISLLIIVFTSFFSFFSTILRGVLKRINEVKQFQQNSLFSNFASNILTYTRNRVKLEDSMRKNVLSTTNIQDIVVNRHSKRLAIISNFVSLPVEFCLFVVNFAGLLKLLSYQVDSLIPFIVVIFLSIFLEVYFYNKKIKLYNQTIDKEYNAREEGNNAKIDVLEIEPINRRHQNFLISNFITSQKKALDVKLKVLKRDNKNGIIFTLFGVAIIVTMTLLIAFSGSKLTPYKLTNVIALTGLFETLLSSVEEIIREYYQLAELFIDYQKCDEKYSTIMKAYYKYEKDKVVNYNDSSFTIKPFDFSYGDKIFNLKLNRDIQFKKGELVFFSGESGVGKTTFMKIISGDIKLDEKIQNNISCIKYFNESSRIGLRNLLEEITLENDEDNIDYEKLQDILKGVNLDKKFSATSLKNIYHKDLSNGMLQRILLARTLYNLQDADLVFLDEPIGNLDMENAISTIRFIKEFCNRDKKRFLILSSHQKNFVSEFIDKEVIFKKISSKCSVIN